MANLDILCSNTLNLKNKITKIEHKNIICGPLNISKNISWPINICLKYLMTPTINLHPSPPTYLMYGPLSRNSHTQIPQFHERMVYSILRTVLVMIAAIFRC